MTRDSGFDPLPLHTSRRYLDYSSQIGRDSGRPTSRLAVYGDLAPKSPGFFGGHTLRDPRRHKSPSEEWI
jgi:hypothetical protein